MLRSRAIIQSRVIETLRLIFGALSPVQWTSERRQGRHDCQNYRGITLLSVPGKVFAHVLLSRVRERLQEKGGYSKLVSHQGGQQLIASSR